MSSYLFKTNTSQKKRPQSGSTFRSWPELCWRKRQLGELGPRSSSPKSPRSRLKPDGTDKTSGRRGRARVGC